MTDLIRMAPDWLVPTLVLLAALVVVLKQLAGLSQTLTRPTENGARENRIETIERTIASHGKMHRKTFSALGRIDSVLREVHAQMGRGEPSVPPVSDDIDAEATGQFDVVEVDP